MYDDDDDDDEGLNATEPTHAASVGCAWMVMLIMYVVSNAIGLLALGSPKKLL